MGTAWLILGTVRKPVVWSQGRGLAMRLERQGEPGLGRASWALVVSLGFILGGMGHRRGFTVASMWRAA